MEIETKEDALVACFGLWIDMSITGGSHKRSSSVWEENGGWIERCLNNCPCCEFAKSQKKPEELHRCHYCPIKWGGNRKRYMCEGVGAAFNKWYAYDGTKKDRTKWALKIATLSMEALYRLYDAE